MICSLPHLSHVATYPILKNGTPNTLELFKVQCVSGCLRVANFQCLVDVHCFLRKQPRNRSDTVYGLWCCRGICKKIMMRLAKSYMSRSTSMASGMIAVEMQSSGMLVESSSPCLQSLTFAWISFFFSGFVAGEHPLCSRVVQGQLDSWGMHSSVARESGTRAMTYSGKI
jgi:hypothetical protein